MNLVIDKVLGSLQERARHFVARRELQSFSAQLAVDGIDRFDTELLKTLASVRAILPELPRVLIDVGAHRGQFAAAADAFFNLEAIYCFEPDTDLHNELRHSVAPEKLRLFDLVVSDQCGMSQFYLHADKSMNSAVAVEQEALKQLFPGDPPSQIRATELARSTLDVALAGVTFPRDQHVMLKVDTQGNELSVLQGAESTMRNVDCCLVEHIFCTPYERHYRFEDLVSLLAEYGFTCEGVVSLTRRPTHQITAVDFLFVRFTR